jgi:hypothetical protein
VRDQVAFGQPSAVHWTASKFGLAAAAGRTPASASPIAEAMVVIQFVRRVAIMFILFPVFESAFGRFT